MERDSDRKNLSLTRDAINQASQQTRLLYGALVKQMREGSHLTQEEIASRSGVSSRTVRNIESGAVAGQAEKLIKIFIALGADLDGDLYSADTQRHLRLLGSLLVRVDADAREAAVAQAAVMLADEIRRHPSPDSTVSAPNVTHANFGGNVASPVQDEHAAAKKKSRDRGGDDGQR